MTQFDPSRDARRQKYVTSGSGTTQAVLTHESVGPDYIAIWLASRMLQASSGPHPDKGAVAIYSGMIASLRTIHPQLVPHSGVSRAHQGPLSGLRTPASEWTDQDQLTALAQGWGVFNNSDHGTQIERRDETMQFDSDEDALAFVEAKAREGFGLHRRALAFVAEKRGQE
jgi:hypothetical protein